MKIWTSFRFTALLAFSAPGFLVITGFGVARKWLAADAKTIHFRHPWHPIVLLVDK